MHKQSLKLWCYLMTGNVWNYIAKKPLYLFTPFSNSHIFFSSKLRLSTKMQTTYQTTPCSPLHHGMWPRLLPVRRILKFFESWGSQNTSLEWGYAWTIQVCSQSALSPKYFSSCYLPVKRHNEVPYDIWSSVYRVCIA